MPADRDSGVKVANGNESAADAVLCFHIKLETNSEKLTACPDQSAFAFCASQAVNAKRHRSGRNSFATTRTLMLCVQPSLQIDAARAGELNLSEYRRAEVMGRGGYEFLDIYAKD
jgi:hypothetical protein